jgi:serpin B
MHATLARSRIAAIVVIGLLLPTVVSACGQASAEDGAPRVSDPPGVLATTPFNASPGRATEHLGLALLPRMGRGNVAFSPDSIAAAVAMLGTGAVGPTATQIARVLDLPSPAGFPAVGELQRKIIAEQSTSSSGERQPPTLQIANGMFLQQGYPLETPFTAGLDQDFGAIPQTVDFKGPAGTEAINAWVAQQTHGLIPQIVEELPPETRLALANAIYLKADWSERFKPNDNASGPFHGEAGTTSTVFMHKTELLPYAHARGYTAVALPYAHSTLSLLLMVPAGQSLSSLERHLQSSGLRPVVHLLSQRNVRISLPRFHLQLHTILNGVLQALGMGRAFSESAEFSGITKAESLRIGEVAHAADFMVDEEGTLAAAATVGTLEPFSLTIYSNVVAFKADRPFLFFLRDDRSGTVLFAGRLVVPQD